MTVITQTPKVDPIQRTRDGSTPTDSEPGSRARKHRRRVLAAVLVLIALSAVAVGLRGWKAAQAWPEGLIQANGRIEGDEITLASKSSGRIVRLNAREGDSVRGGQVVVRVDDAQTHEKLRQAEANLQSATAEAQGASESVALTDETTGALVVQAQGLVGQADSGVAAASADVQRAAAAVFTARATAAGGGANVQTAEAACRAALAGWQRAIAGVGSAQEQVVAARATASAASAEVTAAQAAWDKATRDARRFRLLTDEGAVSEQTGDLYVAAEKTAKAQWDSARQQAVAAAAAAGARQSEVDAARQETMAAEAAVQQAKAQVAAARLQVAAARAGVWQAVAQRRTAQQMVAQARARRQQAAGQLEQARTAPHQVAVSRTNRSQAIARIRQARAAVAELRSVLQDLSTVAPLSGTITTRLRDVGEVVAAGTPLLELVDLDRLYLKVYVPEDQIGKVRLGLPARLFVDAFPREAFPAKVGYIASTAEFTPKEVQTREERVKQIYAVKLFLKSNPGHRLTPGMPADAVIRWKDTVPWRRPQW